MQVYSILRAAEIGLTDSLRECRESNGTPNHTLCRVFGGARSCRLTLKNNKLGKTGSCKVCCSPRPTEESNEFGCYIRLYKPITVNDWQIFLESNSIEIALQKLAILVLRRLLLCNGFSGQ